MTDVWAVIKRELDEAATEARPVICIRLTHDAIPGSPAAVATPTDPRALELLLHPSDYEEMCRRIGERGDPRSIFGVPVMPV